MANNDYSSEGLGLFSMMVAGLLKQAKNIIDNLPDYVDEEENKEEKKEYEAPKCKIVELNKNSEPELKFPKFQYQLVEDPEEGEDKWEGVNDDSPIDKRLKEVLDRLIFKIRINYEGKVEYDVDLHLGDVKARFNWNIDHDRFEGVVYTENTENDYLQEVYYSETESKFYPLCCKEEECCGECCDCKEDEACDVILPETEDAVKDIEEVKEDKPTSVKFNAFSSGGCGAQVKCEEISERENTAEYLYRRLNANVQNKISACLEEVKVAMNRIIDYELFDAKQNEDGEIDTISFDYDLIPANFQKDASSTGFDDINPAKVLSYIKETFGFVEIDIDCENHVICRLK